MNGALGRGSDGLVLLCLDAVSLRADSDSGPSGADPAWSRNAAALLGQARRQGWSVGHVISRRPRPGEAAWRPMAGLAPEPSEPVYHREQPSAFSIRSGRRAGGRAALGRGALRRFGSRGRGWRRRSTRYGWACA